MTSWSSWTQCFGAYGQPSCSHDEISTDLHSWRNGTHSRFRIISRMMGEETVYESSQCYFEPCWFEDLQSHLIPFISICIFAVFINMTWIGLLSFDIRRTWKDVELSETHQQSIVMTSAIIMSVAFWDIVIAFSSTVSTILSLDVTYFTSGRCDENKRWLFFLSVMSMIFICASISFLAIHRWLLVNKSKIIKYWKLFIVYIACNAPFLIYGGIFNLYSADLECYPYVSADFSDETQKKAFNNACNVFAALYWIIILYCYGSIWWKRRKVLQGVDQDLSFRQTLLAFGITILFLFTFGIYSLSGIIAVATGWRQPGEDWPPHISIWTWYPVILHGVFNPLLAAYISQHYRDLIEDVWNVLCCYSRDLSSADREENYSLESIEISEITLETIKPVSVEGEFQSSTHL